MQYRHLFPMLRLLIPFMAGIIVCISISSSTQISFLLWMSLLLLSLAAGFIPFKKLRFVKRWLFGVLISCFLFVSGYNSVLLHKEILRADHFSKIQNKGTFIATVSEPLQEKDHSYKTILRIRGLKKGSTIGNAGGRILTYFAKDSLKNPPGEGSTIVFSAEVQEISPPQNPGAFDYRKYMAANNVYHQVYLNTHTWKLLEKPQGFNLFRTAHMISKKFISILSENGLKGKEFAVASALLLGQKDMLDNETLQAFSGSGVMHILCVSGLHVGVIYIIISFLLGFMKKTRGQIYLKTVLILITIWAYAILTGFSPSVMRAATMFSFISIGNASRRYVHIINSLAVSAVVLLLIDPMMISNIGFQLSYLAIIGIVFINKPIAELWKPTNRIVEYIWGLVAVSIAAQIATSPLSMLYFHQFPTYFIPANIVAVPISFLAIYAGLSVLATSFIPAVSNVVGIITNFLLFALNYCVGFIEHLPHSVLHIHSIFNMEMILAYLILTSLLLLLYLKRKEFVFITLGLLLLFSVRITFMEIIRKEQQKIVFYNSGKQSAVGFIDGKRQTLLADSVLITDKTANKFQLDGARTLYGIASGRSFALDTVTGFYQMLPKELHPLRSLGNNFIFHTKRLVIIDNIPKPKGNVIKLRTDYLWIRNNPTLRVNDLKQLYQPGLIIIDGSNSYSRTEKWMTEFKKAGLKVYSLKKSGAYIVNL